MRESGVIAGIAATILIVIAFISFLPKDRTPIKPEYTGYYCSVKPLSLGTHIIVAKNDNIVCKIDGGDIAYRENPLIMTDILDNVIAYSDDTYMGNLQRDHYININDEIQFNLIGGKTIKGYEYILKDNFNNDIAYAAFNFGNTYGSIIDNTGTIIAEYYSDALQLDYIIYIYENCEIDNNTILLLCASYYSDQNFDDAGE